MIAKFRWFSGTGLRYVSWFTVAFNECPSEHFTWNQPNWLFRLLRNENLINMYETILQSNIRTLEVFLNGAELCLNTGNLLTHWSVNWAQFQDPVSHMCLAGTVVASWFVTQEVAGSSHFNNKYFCHWICRIQWKHLGIVWIFFAGVIACHLFTRYRYFWFLCDYDIYPLSLLWETSEEIIYWPVELVSIWIYTKLTWHYLHQKWGKTKHFFAENVDTLSSASFQGPHWRLLSRHWS